MRVYVEGVGLIAPGLEGWAASRRLLCGEHPYTPTPPVLPASPLLPSNERRRMVTTVKLALQAGAEAFAHARRDPAATASVFTSSGGDGETIHNILESLASAELDVSPTRFHNSVHNAPSGYWAIGTRSRAPTTSLCAHDWSFAAGLLDAAAQATMDDRAVALIAYDLPYPEPLNARRAIESTLAVALVLSPAPTDTSFARLTIRCDRAARPASAMPDPALEALRAGNPAARSLPLLAALARRNAAEIALEYVFDNTLAVSVAPAPW
jgi:hypothetical protein